MRIEIDIPDDIVANMNKIRATTSEDLPICVLRILTNATARVIRDAASSDDSGIMSAQKLLERRRVEAGLDPVTGRPRSSSAPMGDVVRMVADAAAGRGTLDPGAPSACDPRSI